MEESESQAHPSASHGAFCSEAEGRGEWIKTTGSKHGS